MNDANVNNYYLIITCFWSCLRPPRLSAYVFMLHATFFGEDLNDRFKWKRENVAAFSCIRFAPWYLVFVWLSSKEGEGRDRLGQTYGHAATPTDKSSTHGSSWNANGCLGIALGLGANEAHWSDRWGSNSEKELNYRLGKHRLGRGDTLPIHLCSPSSLSALSLSNLPSWFTIIQAPCPLSAICQSIVSSPLHPSSVFPPKNPWSGLALLSLLTVRHQVIKLHLSST